MIANGFRHPFGTGVHTPEFDGDGYYVEQDFNIRSTSWGGLYHRAEDWAYELGNGVPVPLYAPAESTVIAVGQYPSTGNYIILRHDLPYEIEFDGVTTDSVSTLHLHMSGSAYRADGRSLQFGDTLAGGEQFGRMGNTGAAGVFHDHFELRLDGDLTLIQGYTPNPVQPPWVDPTDFILAYRYMGAVTGTDAADAISANVGADSVTGGLGADTLSGAAGDDLVYGNQGADLLFGNAGADTLYGGQDADTVAAGGDDDLLYGNLGADSLDGGAGNDALYGGQGGDVLVGGAGDDTLFGNLGADTMTGGDGADLFRVLGTDTVADFDGSSGDRIAAGGALSTLADTGEGALASFADGSSVVLLGVSGDAVTTDWLMIA